MAEKERTLDTLYGVHRDELFRFLVARTGDRDAAQDLLQELWLRARRSAGAPAANGRAYLYRMAHNLVIDRARERQRRARRERLWSEDTSGTPPPGGEVVDRSLNAEEAILEREETTRLASALVTVPHGARRVFELHKLEGLSHAEVAARLGISKSGVEKHMAVALRYLRRAMLD